MRKTIGVLIALVALSAFVIAQERKGGGGGQRGGGEQRGGQRGGQQGGYHGPEVGGGHIPQHGPVRSTHTAPIQAERGGNPPPQETRKFNDKPGHPEAPHVHNANDQWVGHNEGRNNPRYHLDHPWEHGHFPDEIGARHIWRIEGGGPERFWFGGFYFSIAPADIGFVNGWFWNSDDIVLYPDPDDDGYYLAYNPRLGIYVHVLYLGPG